MPKTFKIAPGIPELPKRLSKWDDAVKAAFEHPGHTITLDQTFKTPGLATTLRRRHNKTQLTGTEGVTNEEDRFEAQLFTAAVPVAHDPNTPYDGVSKAYVIQIWVDKPLAKAEDGTPQEPLTTPADLPLEPQDASADAGTPAAKAVKTAKSTAKTGK